MFPKPEPLRKVRERSRRDRSLRRRACVEAVWARAEGRCQDCGRRVWPAHVDFRLVGHVHEVVSRARGGDELDPGNCQLLCYGCHFSGPGGAHRQRGE